MKNEKRDKKKRMTELRIEACGMVSLANGEAAQCGEATLAQNVRELPSSLQVTGEPMVCNAITVGDRLLLLTGDHTVTSHGMTVKIDGAIVAAVSGNIVGAHAVGDVIVVVSSAGLTYLAYRDGAWMKLDPADAMPQLSIGTTAAMSSVTLDAYTFAESYSQWQAPLADVDVNMLTARLRSAWNTLSADIRAEGRYLSPLMVRWAVRLIDGSYLWMSDPVHVGDMTLSNANRIAARVVTGGGGFTGIEATSLSLTHYGLDIDVTRGIAAEWLPLVSSIDVFVTDESQLLTASRALDYRCLTRTTPGHEYVLEMGLSHRSAAVIMRELAASPWHLIARATVAAAMTGNDFGTADESLTLTNTQCSDLGRMLSVSDVVCSTIAGGRLYCCTRDGDVVVSMAGNALAESHRRRVTGTVPLSMAVVTRPLYSSGFGRYPVYVFTDDGIFAIPQSAAGRLGEARLVDRTVIADGVAPVEGGGVVWLLSRHHHLCRLDGSRLSVLHRDVDCTALAWSGAHSELWMLPSRGFPVVVMPSGRLSVRTIDAAQFYSEPRHAVAVTDAGRVLDLEREQAAVMPIVWHSHPVALHPLLGKPVRRVVWHVNGEQTNLTLKVVGQRGIMTGDSDMSVITVTGTIEQPLATPVLPVPSRTVKFQADGMAATGTLLLPTLLYTL